ncbi:MAG TPA: Gfo/Idh/MocA family oxidoreductase [Conexibacter sp.]|nr:Gfo/Idh/MocA family oxidoreductase [Conexibacter sp.]
MTTASSERRTIRVGLVGAGYMAKTHTLGYRNAGLIYGADVPKVELVAVCDLTEELARAGADRWGWGDATADWRRITQGEDIDLVDVVTPNDAHAEVAIDAALHGKHVICEKPLATRLDDVYAMCDAVAAAGVTHQTGFYYRLWPAVQEARRLIDAGRIGSIRHVRGRFFQDYASQESFPFSWRFDRAAAGAGALGDIGSHILDLVRFLGGDIARIAAQGRTLVPVRPDARGGGERQVDVDDLYSMLLQFESGASGSVEASWAATGHKCDLGFEVIGDRGAIQFTWERSNELRFYSEEDAEAERGFRTVLIGGVHPNAAPFWFAPGQGLGYGDAFTMGIGAMLRGLADGEPVRPDFHDGARAAELVDAALRAHAAGGWVDVARREVPA